MTSSAIPPPSAEDLVLKLRSAPLTERGKIIFSIIAAHQEHPDFAHLVDSLLKTEVVATSIALPTSHDPSAANNLDSDAIATIPEIIHAPLLSPQSNLAARYFEYELGINLAVQAKMNSTLVKELLRPSPIKKREVVAACVDHASDTLIADVYPNCVPAIQNMLVTALIKAGRATLAQSIVGPHKFVTGRESHPCAKLQMDLEKTTDPWQRSPIWETARSAINDISPWMTDSQYEQVLTLQEKFPPLHPLALPGADRMYPALSSIIVALMPILLRRYPKRLKKVVEDTAVVPQGTHAENPTWGLSPHLSKLLSRPKIWTREPDQAIELESILMRLLTFKNGQLLTTGKYPAFDAAFLGRARAPVIDRVMRAAINLCSDVPVNYKNKDETIRLYEANENILKFAIKALKHLVDRLLATSKRVDRIYSFESIFQPIVSSLVELIVKRGLQLARSVSGADDEQFIVRANKWVIRPLIDLHGEAYPPISEQVFELTKEDVFMLPQQPYHTDLCQSGFTMIRQLRHRPCSDISNDGPEPPFSQTPAFSNEAIFALMLAKFSPSKLSNFESWGQNAASGVTLEQKQQIWTYISQIRPQISRYSYGSTLDHIACLAPTHRDMHSIVYELWQKAEHSWDRDISASYLDPTSDIGKEVLTRGLQGATWAERRTGFKNLLAAVQRSGGVPEWIWAARLITTRLRNEIPCNKATLVPLLYHKNGIYKLYRKIPRQYLDMATRSEAEELVSLYLDLEANNLSARKKDESVDDFLFLLADQSLARFASDPSHPFFRFGMEILRRKLRVQARPDEPVRFSTVEYLSDDQDENVERQQRVALQHAKKMAEEHGHWGMMSLPDGCEEQFVAGVLKLRQELFMPPESLSGDLEDSSEYLAQFKELLSALQSRWLRSTTLLQIVGRLVDKLERAPRYDVGGGESVLDWRTDKWSELEAVLAQITTSHRKYMEHHGLKFDWYDRYRELRLQSTLAIEEVQFRRLRLLAQKERQSEDEERAVFGFLAISASAIHLDWVAKYIAKFHTELLSCEYLAGKTIFGRFNPSGTHLTGRISLPTPMTLLSPRQCQTLAKRYLAEVVDTTLPMAKRTESMLQFNKLPTTDTRVLAELLVMPRMPTELLETILMHLPNCPEPGCGIPILLSPTYLRSEFANACILAVKGCLKYAPRSDIFKYLQPLFPQEGEKQQRITVQKEAIRLLFTYLEEPDIRDLIGTLHTRPALHHDVWTVLLKAMLAIVGSGQWEHHPFDQLAWSVLSSAVANPALRINGVCDILLHVQKSSQGTVTSDAEDGNSDAIMVATMSLWWAVLHDPAFPHWVTVHYSLCASLSVLETQGHARSLVDINLPERVHIPSRLQARYLNSILRPLTLRVNLPEMTCHEEAALLGRRRAAYLEISTSWVTPENAAELAAEWFSAWEDSLRISECDTKEADLQHLLAKGVGVCAYHDQNGKAWDMLVSILRKLASVVADLTAPDETRFAARTAINNLQLGKEFLTRHSPSPEWDAMSLVQPLLDYGICGLFWEAIVERHIKSAHPQNPGRNPLGAHAACELMVRITRVAEMYGEGATFIRSYVKPYILDQLDTTVLEDVFGTLLGSANGSLSTSRFSMALKIAFFDKSPTIMKNEIIAWFLDVTNPHSDHHDFYLDNASQCHAILSKSLPADPLIHFLAKGTSGAADASSEHKDDGNLVMFSVVRAKEAGWEGIHASTLLEVLMIAPFACIEFQADNLRAFIHHQITSDPRTASSTIGSVVRHIGLYLQTEGMKSDKMLSANSATINPAFAQFATHLMDGDLLKWDTTRAVHGDNVPPSYTDGTCFALTVQKQQITVAVQGGDSQEEKQTIVVEQERSISTVQDAQNLWDAWVGSSSSSTVPQTPSAPSFPTTRAYRQVAFQFLKAGNNAQAVVYNPRAYMAFMRSCLSATHPQYTPSDLAQVIHAGLLPQGLFPRFIWAPSLMMGLDFVDLILQGATEEGTPPIVRSNLEMVAVHVLMNWRGLVRHVAAPYLIQLAGRDALETRFLDVRSRVWKGHGRASALNIDNPFVKI